MVPRRPLSSPRKAVLAMWAWEVAQTHPALASLSHRRALATIVERMRPALCLYGHLHRTHRTLWEDEESGVRSLVIGLADETQRSANVRVFDLAELAALVGRIRGGEAP